MAAQMAIAASLVSEATTSLPPLSSQSSIDSSAMLLSAGAYQAEAGYDDFSGGLTLPSYNVDNEGQLGLSVPKEKEADPAKLERAKAAAEKKAAAAQAKREAAERKKAAALAAEEAKREANAAKIAAAEEAKARQRANMSAEQRAKLEAYEAQKAEGKKGPSPIDNMKRMYGL